jgi:hypothetical protein
MDHAVAGRYRELAQRRVAVTEDVGVEEGGQLRVVERDRAFVHVDLEAGRIVEHDRRARLRRDERGGQLVHEEAEVVDDPEIDVAQERHRAALAESRSVNGRGCVRLSDASEGTVRAICCSRARRSALLRSIRVEAADALPSRCAAGSAHPAQTSATASIAPPSARDAPCNARPAACREPDLQSKIAKGERWPRRTAFRIVCLHVLS